MDRRLIKKYGERDKLLSQINSLQEKLNKVNRDVIELEKVELYKNFEVMDISLEEYKKIVEGKVSIYQGRENIVTKQEDKNEEI
ncbi:MAG: hypothetical protein GXZ08_01285 [Tissierellia bacterium]|nr:hypothetical protein [Tissierellia bacterium]